MNIENVATSRAIAIAEKRVEELCSALTEVLQLIEDGLLVRDITHDHRADYVRRTVRLVTTLKKAADAAGIA